jgi:hypothetical protein
MKTRSCGASPRTKTHGSGGVSRPRQHQASGSRVCERLVSRPQVRIFTFIESGTFLTETGRINDPAKEVTRHGTAHGVFKNFESRR